MNHKRSQLNKNYINYSSSNRTGIVHLGVGAFHKAHQAWYTHKAMEQFGGDWKITGVSLRSPRISEQMNPQDCIYTVVEKSDEQVSSTIVSSVDKVLAASESLNQIVEALREETLKIVSLTITEKGYYHDPASGHLMVNNPDIQHDLQNIDKPRTAIGFLVNAMQYRLTNNISPFTVLSCDNLPLNGQLLRGLVLEFATQISEALAESIANTYTFPCSMVDRIVPAVTEESRKDMCNRLGYEDTSLVITEPFSQWVIEDNFVAGKPAWEKVGALLVDDVHSFETMKLRLLNGSHSAIAYIGYLSQFETVSDAVSNPIMAEFIKDLMKEELMPSVAVTDNIDLDEYCQRLRKRFSNSALQHKTYQIAMDGSQKLPQRLLMPLQYQVANNGNYSRICFVIAAWFVFTRGQDLLGNTFEVQDPMAQVLSEAFSASNGGIDKWVNAVMGIDSLFTQDLASNKIIINLIKKSISSIIKQKKACNAILEIPT